MWHLSLKSGAQHPEWGESQSEVRGALAGWLGLTLSLWKAAKGERQDLIHIFKGLFWELIVGYKSLSGTVPGSVLCTPHKHSVNLFTTTLWSRDYCFPILQLEKKRHSETKLFSKKLTVKPRTCTLLYNSLTSTLGSGTGNQNMQRGLIHSKNN